MPDIADKPIFGRYSREDCGLPPAGEGKSGWRGLAARTGALLLLLVAAGWAAGIFAARWREAWVGSLPGQVGRANDVMTSELLARGKLYATALPDNQRMRDDLSLALLLAAEQAPRRMGYYGNLANLYTERDAGGHSTGVPERDFAAELTSSGVFAELEQYDKAFLCLARADEALSRYTNEPLRRAHRLLQVNAQAYYLAVAPVRSGGNPEKALHLAQLLISSRDELPGGGHASGQAAFMDTLAAAWFAAGDAEKAVDAQKLALGLADATGLDVYVKHYDQFNRALWPAKK